MHDGTFFWIRSKQVLRWFIGTHVTREQMREMKRLCKEAESVAVGEDLKAQGFDADLKAAGGGTPEWQEPPDRKKETGQESEESPNNPPRSLKAAVRRLMKDAKRRKFYMPWCYYSYDELKEYQSQINAEFAGIGSTVSTLPESDKEYELHPPKVRWIFYCFLDLLSLV
jgi:hypothetical protein